MSEWIADRAPTQQEAGDYTEVYATIMMWSSQLGPRLCVERLSGFVLRQYPPGECLALDKFVVAWMPIPQPYDADAEAKETAELLVAMRSCSDEKLRNCLHGKR